MKSPREALQPEAAPPPPPNTPRRKRTSLVSIISGVLSFIIVATVVLGIGWSMAAKRVLAPGPLPDDKTVNIPKGDDVAETLEEQGVIENAQFLKGVLLAEGNKGNVKAGEYLFKQSASLQDVIDTLVSGKQVLHSLTIPEGLTSLQTIDRLRDNDILVGDIKAIPPEGSLMPDTYKFSRGTTRDQLVRNMQQESKRVVADVWLHREADTPIRSPYEMVTLASIVEKETGKADERPRVAGVFMNRLAKNIPLQSDPTIVYGIVGGKGTLGRGIMKSEVEQKTPYNTYAITGLPPGPIANPGKAALEAVANPSKTKDLYFVADGTGGHAFAETLDQHRANFVKWRQIEKDAKDKLTPDADKVGPALPGATTGKGSQRGDIDDTPQVFGQLVSPGAVSPAPGTRPPTPDRLGVFATSLPTGLTAFSPVVAATPFNELNVMLDGVPSDDDVSVDPAGAQPLQGGEGTMQTFPVSASHQAEIKARAAQFGLPQSSDALPKVQTAMETAVAPGVPAGRIKIYDASEGTSLDPLRDRTYDLNTPKSVPVLKALPPMPVSMAN